MDPERWQRLSPLLDALLEIERRFGRDRATEERWGPRALDLDLLLFGDGPRVTQSQHAVDASRGEVTGTVHAKNWVEREASFRRSA